MAREAASSSVYAQQTEWTYYKQVQLQLHLSQVQMRNHAALRRNMTLPAVLVCARMHACTQVRTSEDSNAPRSYMRPPLPGAMQAWSPRPSPSQSAAAYREPGWLHQPAGRAQPAGDYGEHGSMHMSNPRLAWMTGKSGCEMLSGLCSTGANIAAPAFGVAEGMNKGG